ncbi:hypothetical protein [Intestinibacter sp.]
MKKLNLEIFIELVIIMLMVSIIGACGNFVGYQVPIMESIPGMLILFVIALLGTLCTYIIPIKNCPPVIWISIIGVLLACPASPVAEQVNLYVGKINMLALATCILGFAGISMSKNWADFKKIGWRGVVVACVVMFGTFIGSTLVAQVILSMTGVI